jgi:hypothetical protein
MIQISEVELLAGKHFAGHRLIVWQVNQATIRIKLDKASFIDIFQSLKDPGKFAFHAQIQDKVYRLDCRPEKKYLKLKTFPWHFHKGKEERVMDSPFSTKKNLAIVQFFAFIREHINN